MSTESHLPDHVVTGFDAMMRDDDAFERNLTRDRLLRVAGASLVGAALATPLGRASTAFAAGSKTLGWSQSHFVALWYSVAIPNFRAEAKKKRYSVIEVDAQNDPGQESANFNNLLTKGVDGIVILPVAGPEAVPLVSQAKQQGVPVVAFNTPVMSGDLTAFVARDNVRVGMLMARAALKAVRARGNWVICNGDPANAVSQDLEKGYHAVLDPYIKARKINLVSDEFNKGFNPSLARAQVEDALTKTNDKITAILTAADETAIGPLAAIQERGLAGKVYMSSQNGTQAICRAILQRQYNLSVVTRYDVGAKVAADVLLRALSGQKIKGPRTFNTGQGSVPFFPVGLLPITHHTLVKYLTYFSPSYVNAKQIYEGVPKSLWPAGSQKLLARQP